MKKLLSLLLAFSFLIGTTQGFVYNEVKAEETTEDKTGTVTFYINNNVFDTETCTIGERYILPDASQINVTGYTFEGWEDGEGKPVTASTIWSGNERCIAKLRPIQKKIAFIVGSNTYYYIQTYDQPWVLPPAPQVTGFNFFGWVDNNGVSIGDSDTFTRLDITSVTATLEPTTSGDDIYVKNDEDEKSEAKPNHVETTGTVTITDAKKSGKFIVCKIACEKSGVRYQVQTCTKSSFSKGVKTAYTRKKTFSIKPRSSSGDIRPTYIRARAYTLTEKRRKIVKYGKKGKNGYKKKKVYYKTYSVRKYTKWSKLVRVEKYKTEITGGRSGNRKKAVWRWRTSYNL